MIISLGFKTIIRSNKIKKASFTITEVSIKDLSKIVKELKDLPYEGYVSNRYKHMPTDSYFYIARQLVKCMMSNSRSPVRTQKRVRKR